MKSKMTLGKIRHLLGAGFVDLDVADDTPVYRKVTLETPLVPATRELEKDSMTAIQVISTSAVDADGTIIDPEGVDMSRFMKNPVVLWSHNYAEPPIGSDERVWIEDGKRILAKTRYADTPRAKEVFSLKQQGHLRASSISFFPRETKTRHDEDWEEVLKKYGLKLSDKDLPYEIYTKSEMIEHSDVPVGSNPEALLVAVSRGLTLSTGMMKTLGIEAEQVEPRVTPATVAPRNITREIFNSVLRMKGKIL